jgi:outer membrane murein-binding lipoprotein Lpp
MLRPKYMLLLVVVAVVVAAVPIAQGTSSAKDPRVTKLTKQVNALKTRVGSLESDVSSLKSDVGTLKSDLASLTTDETSLKQTVGSLQSGLGCLQYKALPVTQYGAASGEGFVYATGNGANVYLVTALDVTASGQTPQFWVNEVNPSCVKSFNGNSAPGRPARQLKPFLP